ncbi:MAG: hypothetical protein LUH02_01100, partial [Erysipelotrichaceae bacterium]|nr:hypothetical protein [Erysipelotrichaceae bacterium]
NNHQLEKIFYDIKNIQINVFVKVLLNTRQQYLTPYHQQYLYLMPFLENNDYIANDIKIRKYFELISYLHNHSFYNLKVNEHYFQQLHDQLLKNIQARLNYYQQLMLQYEKMTFRSPTQWYFVMNYYHIYQALEKSHSYFLQFMELTKGYSSIRVCYNYLNFDFAHIIAEYPCLIAMDHICLQIPVFDLYHVFQNENFTLLNTNMLLNHYFCDMTLGDDEKLLLKCLLNIVPRIEFKSDEVDNIYLLTQLLNYIDEVEHFIHQI